MKTISASLFMMRENGVALSRPVDGVEKSVAPVLNRLLLSSSCFHAFRLCFYRTLRCVQKCTTMYYSFSVSVHSNIEYYSSLFSVFCRHWRL